MAFDPGLKQGTILNNNELCEIFKCSTQGGMRRSKTTDTLVIISNHVKSIYNDRWINEILQYTGMGMKGDQSIEFAQNKTLAESYKNGVDVHLFEVYKEREYTYIGRVALAGDPYLEQQPDQKGNSRIVWMFPLKLVDGPIFQISEEQLKENIKKKEIAAKKLSNQELKLRAIYSPKKAGSRLVRSSQYERSAWIGEYARRRAKGKCQLCGNSAPFRDKNGEPFLETHHITWLSKGGEDSIGNTVSLCPNCHRKMHILDFEEDKKYLFSIARKEIS